MTMGLIQMTKEILQKQIFDSNLRKSQVPPSAKTLNTSHFQALGPSLEGGSHLQEKTKLDRHTEGRTGRTLKPKLRGEAPYRGHTASENLNQDQSLISQLLYSYGVPNRHCMGHLAGSVGIACDS